jgi:hypothetical protein
LASELYVVRTTANIDSRSIQDTMEFMAGRLTITRDQAKAQIANYNFLKVPATVQDTANAAVLVASDRARMITGTVVNATAGAALDQICETRSTATSIKKCLLRDRPNVLTVEGRVTKEENDHEPIYIFVSR